MIKVIKRIRYQYVLFVMFFKKKIIDRASVNSGKKDNSIFFIFGSGRNGSTLLARLLNTHSQIFLPPEQFALPYTIIDWHSSLFKNPLYYTKKQLKRYFTNNQNWIWNTSDLSSLEEKIDHTGIRPRSLFKSVLQYYSELSGAKKEVFGDHSPITTSFYKYIYDEFPQDKYIFLLRHPYDVVLSYSKILNNPASNSVIACNKWNNSINAYDYLINKGAKVILIRYEDLVTKTDETLAEILNFLEVKSQDLTKEKIENIEKSLGTKFQNHHKNLFNPINSSSVNKWKVDLDSDLALDIHKYLIKNSLRFNYDLNR